MKSRCFGLISVLCLLSVLTGCIALPGQEPFGEKTYSSEDAQTVYEEVASSMLQRDFSDFGGYDISVIGALEDDFISYDVYKTEEYTAAYYEGDSEEYLWHNGFLYCYGNERLAYRDMAWEELLTEEYALEKWAFAQQLLRRKDGELTYQYIPMSHDNPYLLTVEYDEAEMDGRAICFVGLSFYLKRDGNYEGFGLSWQEKQGKTNRAFSISFFPYGGSSSLLAERKIWSFGYEMGLTEENIPSISEQEENRQQCRRIISDMDFETLREQAEYNKDLIFPGSLSAVVSAAHHVPDQVLVRKHPQKPYSG